MRAAVLLLSFLIVFLSGCIIETPQERAIEYLAGNIPDDHLGVRIHIALAAASAGEDLSQWPDTEDPILHRLSMPQRAGDILRLTHALELAGMDAPDVTREELRTKVIAMHDGSQFGADHSITEDALAVSALLAGGAFHPSDKEIHTTAKFLIDAQWHDGGWRYSGYSPGEPDETGFVLRALSDAGLLFGDTEANATRFLADRMAPDGSYDYDGNTNCQSSGLALMGWAALQERAPDAARQYVLSCQNPDGGFPHVKGGPSQAWATAEIVQGLAAAS